MRIPTFYHDYNGKSKGCQEGKYSFYAKWLSFAHEIIFSKFSVGALAFSLVRREVNGKNQLTKPQVKTLLPNW